MENETVTTNAAGDRSAKGNGKFPVLKNVGKKLYASRKAYLFLLPLFFFLLTFSYYPALSGIYHSFFDWKDSGESAFIGWKNYREFLSDTQVFWPS